jgi:hypothetical protein
MVTGFFIENSQRNSKIIFANGYGFEFVIALELPEKKLFGQNVKMLM